MIEKKTGLVLALSFFTILSTNCFAKEFKITEAQERVLWFMDYKLGEDIIAEKDSKTNGVKFSSNSKRNIFYFKLGPSGNFLGGGFEYSEKNGGFDVTVDKMGLVDLVNVIRGGIKIYGQNGKDCGPYGEKYSSINAFKYARENI